MGGVAVKTRSLDQQAMRLAAIALRKAKTFSMPKWAHTGVKLAKDLGDSLPNKNSTTAQKILMSIGSIQTVQTALWPAQGNPVKQYCARHGLKEQRSEQFVKLFFTTDLCQKFEIGRIRISDYQTIVEARGALGHFAFVEGDYGEGPEATYYVADKVDMPAVLDGLWTLYEGRLHVTVTSSPYAGTRSEFARFSLPDAPLYGSAKGRMTSALARHRRFVACGTPRSYMFYGPPGTGKSCFASAFADRLGEKTIKMDAGSLAHASVRDVSFLLDNLRPDFVIVDDVDKASVGSALPTLLDVLGRFKSEGSGASVLMTANSVTGFDAGLLRPGRIDTWIEFGLPDAAERLAVLGEYADDLCVDISTNALATLASESEGLSQDYMREIVLEMRHRSRGVEEVVDAIRTMKKLLAKPEVKVAPAAAPSPS